LSFRVADPSRSRGFGIEGSVSGFPCYTVGPMDPETSVSFAVGLGFVALFACYSLALRATRTDPIVAVRNE